MTNIIERASWLALNSNDAAVLELAEVIKNDEFEYGCETQQPSTGDWQQEFLTGSDYGEDWGEHPEALATVKHFKDMDINARVIRRRVGQVEVVK